MRRKQAALPVGQLLIMGFEGAEMTAGLASLLQQIQPAGVILFARNIESPRQTFTLLRACQAQVHGPLFTCIDLEGGTVDRFRKILRPTPAAAEVYATHDRRVFQRHGRLIGDCCRALGLNTDFAPVVDLAFPASLAVMNSRAVSADPRQAAAYAREFLRGLAAAKVLGAIKHFPGLGEANLDTHHELPRVEKSFAKLWQQDLAPYRLLRRTAPMVLVGHAAYPAVTGDETPASLSKKWIGDVLRKKLGYRKLVVSDDLEMGGVLKAASIGEAAVGHIRAGGDLALVCHLEERVREAYCALVAESERSPAFTRRCRESLGRIEAFKKQSRELKPERVPPSEKKVAGLVERIEAFAEAVRKAAAKVEANP